VAAGWLLAVTLVVLVGMILLAFVVPGMERLWSESGRELSGLEKLLFNLSRFCRTYGFLLLPVVVAAVIAAAAWLFISLRRTGAASAGN